MSTKKFVASEFPNFLFTAKPETLGDVVEMLEAIDVALPDKDGVAWWNRIYLITTKQLHAQTDWDDPNWVSRLDVNFAERYFDSLRQLYSGQTVTTHAWRALYAARWRDNIGAIQFVMAGMIAHITFDLAEALVITNEQLNTTADEGSAQWRDYQKVNAAFKVLVPKALAEVDSGLWGSAAAATGLPGQLVAQWEIQQTRDAAWHFAGHLRKLKVNRRLKTLKLMLEAQNVVVGMASATMLLPLDPVPSKRKRSLRIVQSRASQQMLALPDKLCSLVLGE